MSDVSPERFIDNVFAYQRTAAVKAAIELDVFSAIGAGADSVEALAAKVNAAPRGTGSSESRSAKPFREPASLRSTGNRCSKSPLKMPGGRSSAAATARSPEARSKSRGDGYDLVLMPNFLHHFDRGECVSLLERAHRALVPGGAVIVVEMGPNDDRVSPPFPAMFAFVMLGSTPKGDAWTAAELEAMGRAAGFARSRIQALPPSPQTMVVFG
jgi:hypothetical protein